LKHVLREKYDQNRIPVSDIRLWKWENGSFVEASKQELHELYEYNMQHRQRKNANVFWEYMLSGYDSEKTAEVAKYLCNFFDNRTVFAIEHRDEGHYHTHFIIFCKDFAHEKSPNIPKGKLHRIRWDLGKITGQKVKEGHRSPETCGSKLRCVLSSSSANETRRNRQKIQEYTGTNTAAVTNIWRNKALCLESRERATLRGLEWLWKEGFYGCRPVTHAKT